MSRSPSSALLPTFFGEGFPTKIDKQEKSWYPYSNLSNPQDIDNDNTSWASATFGGWLPFVWRRKVTICFVHGLSTGGPRCTRCKATPIRQGTCSGGGHSWQDHGPRHGRCGRTRGLRSRGLRALPRKKKKKRRKRAPWVLTRFERTP